MQHNILIIPAEGDSAMTERWYAEDLKAHYPDANIVILLFGQYVGKPLSRHDLKKYSLFGNRVNVSMRLYVSDAIHEFFLKTNMDRFEIHAQGGFGAYVAQMILEKFPERVKRVFLLGGAPSDAMGWHQKLFHRHISRFWYFSKIPFFADDPNPYHDEKIAKIRDSSTAAMRGNPELYRDQLVHLGTWRLDDGWKTDKEVYFVPNGKTVRASWLDNSYNNKKAAKIWKSHNVKVTRQPSKNWSFYSLMPSEALFEVMDEVRHFCS